MKKMNHWNAYYIRSRVKEIIDHKMRPEDPWLTRQAIDLLGQLLKPTDTAVEFGSGRSTIWFAKHVGHLTSVEHSPEWHKMIGEKLKQQGISNVDYLLKSHNEHSDPADSDYVKVIQGFGDETIDFALVDGMSRDICALKLVPKMRRGGLFVLDNAGWFVPSATRTPNAIGLGQPHYSEASAGFLAATESWRWIWTTSGVTDTLLLFKP
jgi:predicted O-methyltransferase YrrM